MYEVKGKNDKRSYYVLCENAIDVIEAANNAMAAGMSEIFSVFLSKVKEVYHYVSDEEKEVYWYKLTVGDVTINEKTGKKKLNKYAILIQEENLDTANRKADEILSQGYNMVKVKIEETKIDAVV